MAASPLKLEGKVAIVTGGASGIGEATVRLFAAHGASVVIADIQDSLGVAVAASVPPLGRCSYVRCDVRDELQVAAAVDHAVVTYGRLDVMFSNAGILGTVKDILDLDMAAFDEVMAVNVRGTAAAIKHAGRVMVNGSIICTASVAAVQGGFGPAAYTATKHAVLGLARAAAAELGDKGVRVNCLSPFVVAAPMNCGADRKRAASIKQIICEAAVLKGRVLRAPDISAAALFLASEDSAFISGQNLVIDGAVTSVNKGFFKFAQAVTAAAVGSDGT